MNKHRLTILHSCGCVKVVIVNGPAQTLDGLRSQLECEPCRSSDCKARGRRQQRAA